MENEMNRLSTFFNYPPSLIKVYPISLARSGFYYTGRDCVVKCHCCRITLQNVQSNVDMENRHRSASPKCTYVLEYRSGNRNSTFEAGYKETVQSDEYGNDSDKHALSNTAGRETGYSKSEPFPEREALESDNLTVVSYRTKVDIENSLHDGCHGTTVQGPDNYVLTEGLPLASFDLNLQSMAVGGTTESGVEQGEDSVPHVLQRVPDEDIPRHDISHQDGSNAPNYHCVNALGQAGAGFYFPMSDTAGLFGAACFRCDGGRKNLQTSDGIWNDHAQWFRQGAILRECMSLESVQPAQLLPHQAGMARSVGNDAAGAVTATGGPSGLDRQKVTSAVETHERRVMTEINDDLEQIKRTMNDGLERFNRTMEQVTTLQQRLVTLDSEKSSDLNVGNNIIALEETNPATTDAVRLETEKLLSKNDLLGEAHRCKVCLDNEVDTVFLPCGHLVCCMVCAPDIKNCPVCRALIRGTVRVFFGQEM